MNSKTVTLIGSRGQNIGLRAGFREFQTAATLAVIFAISAAGTLSAQSTAKAPEPHTGEPTQNVAVVNTPTVTVSNPVALSGTPSVVVANSKTTPVQTQNVDNPAHHPFSANCVGTSGGGTNVGCVIIPPSATQVVIQYINIAVQSNNPSSVVGGQFFYTGGEVWFPTVAAATGMYYVNQPVVLYQGVNSALQCAAWTTPGNSSLTQLNCLVSGYTVTP